jgi:hypothetical protein
VTTSVSSSEAWDRGEKKQKDRPQSSIVVGVWGLGGSLSSQQRRLRGVRELMV